MLFKFLLDGVILIGLVMLLKGDSKLPDMYLAGGSAIGITVFTFVLALLLAHLGVAGLLLALLASSAVATLVMMFVFELEPQKALVGGLLFVFYKVITSGIFTRLGPAPEEPAEEFEQVEEAASLVLQMLTQWV